MWLCYHVVLRFVCKAGCELWNLRNEQSNASIQCLARDDPYADVFFYSPWRATGDSFRRKRGGRVVQKACKGRRTVVKRSSDSYAKVAQNPYQGRPTLMQRSSKNHANVVQQLFKVRPTVTRRSPNTYGNVLQQFCKCNETVMQRSSHGYANVTNIMRRLANLHGGNLYSWVR